MTGTNGSRCAGRNGVFALHPELAAKRGKELAGQFDLIAKSNLAKLKVFGAPESHVPSAPIWG